ncbi:unnamed protein product [Coregonus sp. 'balchen']|nr:unnamed protein product [Coregonus sp. 'balchen']
MSVDQHETTALHYPPIQGHPSQPTPATVPPDWGSMMLPPPPFQYVSAGSLRLSPVQLEPWLIYRFHMCRLFLKSHSGTAGRQSSMVIHGADFSTKDMDNDNCICKCWWFDACGPSNLNGMYFTKGQHVGKLNGIKWHYFKGPSYSLRATTMMIRPLDFS